MNNNSLLLLAILLVSLVALIGFFKTKAQGFGRFATSSLLLLFVVAISSLLSANGELDSKVFANILFAVIGFAGGLFTGKEPQDKTAKP